MSRPICVTCKKEMFVEKNEVAVYYTKATVSCRYGDRWKCPECGHQIIAGLAPTYVLKPDRNEIPEDGKLEMGD